MVLSNKRILSEMENGSIVIEPFNKDNLATSSYDVTLGKFYYAEERPMLNRVYNPYSEEEVRRIWGEAQKASPAGAVLGDYNFRFNGVRHSDLVILLAPGETILAHTEEFIGGKNHITTMMKARSSLGRNFIEVCKCAGWGDVGYFNRWTMEITNNSQHYHIPLVAGRRIAQIIFFETGPVLDAQYESTGKYQTTKDVEKLAATWTPEMMLPKMYNDRELKL